jgi:hypothetical protein
MWGTVTRIAACDGNSAGRFLEVSSRRSLLRIGIRSCLDAVIFSIAAGNLAIIMIGRFRRYPMAARHGRMLNASCNRWRCRRPQGENPSKSAAMLILEIELPAIAGTRYERKMQSRYRFIQAERSASHLAT